MISQLKNAIQRIDPIDFSLILTVFFIITHFQKIVSNNPFIFVPMVLLGAMGILFQGVRQFKWFWVVLTAFYGMWIILYWQTIDNHMYLWGYWLLGIALSRFSKTPNATLRYSAQYLVAGCMVFAVIQKINPTFLSGDFFRYTLITDSRFFFIGPLIQFNMMDVIQENRQLIEDMMSHSKRIILTPGPPILDAISMFLTGYVLMIEGGLALLFLGPRRRWHHAQHWVLFLFFSLYFLLPIRGFAFTLIAMGMALVNRNDTALKAIYIGFLLYMVTMSDLVVSYLFSSMYPLL